MKYLSNVSTLTYDESLCTGCRYCSQVCPSGVFIMESKKAVITDKDLCIECGACQKNCDSNAITVLAGVGCSSALIQSFFTGEAPSCGCSDGSKSVCC
ncbi:MAG: mercury methylation ferredoxin HgcB [Spirochaetia bacterium]|nr:mercury methylation ferredoxin HgcB [Spirochaetia bacterium]